MKLSDLTVTVPKKTDGDTAWFQHDRFGLFIHFGLYSLPARHEWVMSKERIPKEVYRKYFEHFNPDLLEPEKWARAAKRAGMKYFVVTTKHHEGFCLWDSAYTDYKATNTPYGKDVLDPIIAAFRKEGLRVGLYHSLMDWHHDDYTLDKHHPMRDDADYAAGDADRDLSRYTDYLHAQTEELLRRYPDTDILWFDFSPKPTDRFPGKSEPEWRGRELVRKVRALRPGIIINDRLGFDCDVKTPEQESVDTWPTVNGEPIVWEACHTFSGSWGYYRDEETWKSPEQLVKLLIDTVSCGGNLIMNVGPTGRGELDARAFAALEAIGNWMDRHSASIYGCTQAPEAFRCPRDCRLTYNPDTQRLYLHVYSWPCFGIRLEGELAAHVSYAQILSDASEVQTYRSGDGSLLLDLPVKKPLGAEVPVIELFLE